MTAYQTFLFIIIMMANLLVGGWFIYKMVTRKLK